MNHSSQVLEFIHKENNNPIVVDIENDNKILDEFQELKGSLKYKKNLFDEYYLNTKEDYHTYQSLILSGFYIVIYFNDDELRIITEGEKVFILNLESIDISVLTLLFRLNKPRVISLDSSILYNTFNNACRIYDITHVVSIFYNAYNMSLKDIIKYFTTEQVDDDINNLLYNLLHIKSSINAIIEKYSLFPMLNKEFDVLKAISHCKLIGLPYNQENYEHFEKEITEKYKNARNNLSLSTLNNISDIDSLFKALYKKDECLILNKKYLENSEQKDLYEIVSTLDCINKIGISTFEKSEKRMFPKYLIYDEFGNVNSSFFLFEYASNFLISDNNKLYVVGHFPDLIYRLFVNISRIDYLKESLKDNRIIESIVERVFRDKDSIDIKYYDLLTRAFLDGFLQGHLEIESIRNYLFDEYLIYVPDSNIRSLYNLFNKNVREIMESIYKFPSINSKDRRLSFDLNATNIYRYLKLSEADIIKTALVFIYENILEYKRREKNGIELIGLIDNKIIIESDIKTSNIACDIMNRNLTSAYTKYSSGAYCEVKTCTGKIKG